MPPANKTCPICGKIFAKSKKISYRQWEEQRFCSRECGKKWLRIIKIGTKQSNETKRKIGEKSKASWLNKEIREKRLLGLRKITQNSEWRKKISQQLRKFYEEHPEKKQELIERVTRFAKENREFFRKRAKQMWETGIFDEEVLKKLHEGLKRSWKENYEKRKEIFIKSTIRPEIIRKRAEKVTGANAPYWKGENARYSSKHRWIQKHWQKTGICQWCGAKPKPFGNRKYGTEWANISGEYRRDDRNDWLELCPTCHHKFDKGLLKINEKKNDTGSGF